MTTNDLLKKVFLCIIVILAIISIKIFVNFVKAVIKKLENKNITVLNDVIIILIKIAEKYISVNGFFKMEFVSNIVFYLYKSLYKALNIKIDITYSEVVKQCQVIYDNVKDSLKDLTKNIKEYTEQNNTMIVKDIEEIITTDVYEEIK